MPGNAVTLRSQTDATSEEPDWGKIFGLGQLPSALQRDLLHPETDPGEAPSARPQTPLPLTSGHSPCPCSSHLVAGPTTSAGSCQSASNKIQHRKKKDTQTPTASLFCQVPRFDLWDAGEGREERRGEEEKGKGKRERGKGRGAGALHPRRPPPQPKRLTGEQQRAALCCASHRVTQGLEGCSEPSHFHLRNPPGERQQQQRHRHHRHRLRHHRLRLPSGLPEPPATFFGFLSPPPPPPPFSSSPGRSADRSGRPGTEHGSPPGPPGPAAAGRGAALGCGRAGAGWGRGSAGGAAGFWDRQGPAASRHGDRSPR